MSKRDKLQQVQLQIDEIQKKLSKLSMPPIDSIKIVISKVECESNQETNTNGGECEIMYDDGSGEEEIEALTENNKLHDELSPLEIHIILPPSLINKDLHEDLIWSSSSLSPFGSFFEPSQSHQTKRSPFVHIFQVMLYLAKNEGIYNQDSWDVLYDTYYEKKSFFDELL